MFWNLKIYCWKLCALDTTFRPMSTIYIFYWDHFRDFRINAHKMYWFFSIPTRTIMQFTPMASLIHNLIRIVFFYFFSSLLSLLCCGEIVRCELSSMKSLLRRKCRRAAVAWERLTAIFWNASYRRLVILENHASALQYWILMQNDCYILYYTFGQRTEEKSVWFFFCYV